MGKTVPVGRLRRGFGIHIRAVFTQAGSTLIFLLLVLLLKGCVAAPAAAQNDSEMVEIPAGPFVMGTDRRDDAGEGLQFGFPTPWFEDEHPARTVHLDGFLIDRYEVTNREYRRFVQATGHRPPAHWMEKGIPPGLEDHPVVSVDWYDADDFCRWSGKRLPTEEQWEKAARGADGRQYPWGDTFDSRKGNVATSSSVSGQTVPVGRYPDGRSVFGVEDMIGNVWEWTDSWYLPYPGNNIYHPSFGMKARVVRGLSFNPLGHYPNSRYPRILAVFARASARGYEPPTVLLGDVGFRCAVSK